jgi:hypothetical protein
MVGTGWYVLDYDAKKDIASMAAAYVLCEAYRTTHRSCWNLTATPSIFRENPA